MTVTVSPVYLLDVQADAAVEAELHDAIQEPQLAHWESLWLPALYEAILRLRAAGVPPQEWPQSAHWNWRAKHEQISQLLAHRTFSVMCGGETQGLMAVNLTKAARLDSQKGKPLVYVEYVENAPWNRPELYSPTRYRGVGSILIRAAIQVSIGEEFKGRIGLHSLPQADRFYQRTCGMTDLGPDPAYHNLRYFEMTPEQAEAFNS
jgi:hypothetical protein